MGNLTNLKKEAPKKMRMQIVKKVVDWVRGLVIRPKRHADNPFHTQCQKFLKKLSEAPERELAHSVLLKRMKTNAKDFHAIVELLELEGDIETVTIPNRTGRAKRSYRLTKGGFNDGSRKA